VRAAAFIAGLIAVIVGFCHNVQHVEARAGQAREEEVTFTNGDVTLAGTLTASTTPGEHPDVANAGIDPAQDVNRYWTLSQDASLAFTNYDATFNFVSGDLDPSANTSEFIVAKRDGAAWTQPTVLTRSATSIEAGGLTSFSEFVVGQPAADVGVLFVGSPEPVLVGGTLTYTVTVQNAGPSPASNVVLTDLLPAGVAYQSVITSQGSCSQSNGTVTCALGGLAANATATVTLMVTASTPGTATNTVTITATETDPQTLDNTASWTTTINPVPPPGNGGSGTPSPETDPQTPSNNASWTGIITHEFPPTGSGGSEQAPPPEDDGISSAPSGGTAPDGQAGESGPADPHGSMPVGAIALIGMLAIGLTFLARRLPGARDR